MLSMGDVPTHGPWCRRVRAYPTRCPSCRAGVVYFECSCGSKVFLETGGGGSHECGRRAGSSLSATSRPVRRRRTPASDLRSCPRCRVRMRAERLLEHLRLCGA